VARVPKWTLAEAEVFFFQHKQGIQTVPPALTLAYQPPYAEETAANDEPDHDPWLSARDTVFVSPPLFLPRSVGLAMNPLLHEHVHWVVPS
jgi:hypothetical protein